MMTSTSATPDVKRRPAAPGAAMGDRATPGTAVDMPRGVCRDLAAPEVAMAATRDGSGEEPRRYAGGKNGAGVYHRLINMTPPHLDFIEAFLGSGAMIRRKRPAPGFNVGLDVDAGIIAKHVAACDRRYDVLHLDALAWLNEFLFPARPRHAQTFVYCDPPYLGLTRYRHSMKDEEGHRELLRILTTTTAMVMLSGYASELYDEALAAWRRVTFMAQTRGGMKEEVVWMNYPEPAALHDYRYLGEDYHDRCRIQRKIKRNIAKLAAMPVLERAAVLDAISCSSAAGDAARVASAVTLEAPGHWGD